MNRKISSRNKKTCKITARDHQVLRFLWKWKLASTAAIACRFFPKINLLSGLRRLQFLETDKYIKCIQISPEHGHVWSLTDRGFKYIRHSLKDIEHMGYKSEHLLHDYLVTAFHLGEWLTKQPTKSENFSEQQLRRNTQSTWPIWVPKSLAHRPDGYSICTYQGQKMLMAFEVELSVKTKERYGATVAFYDSEESIDGVAWLVDGRGNLSSIQKILHSFQCRRLDIHHFVSLSDFLEHGWNAPFLAGKYKGLSLSKILIANDVAKSSQMHHTYDAFALLDSRKRPNTSISYKDFRKSKIAD